MAINIIFTLYARAIEDYRRTITLSPDRIQQAEKECIEKILKLKQEEIQRAIGHYLRSILLSLYEDNEKLYKGDVAKLMLTLDGKPAVVDLTTKERLTMAKLLMEKCRKTYGDKPLEML